MGHRPGSSFALSALLLAAMAGAQEPAPPAASPSEAKGPHFHVQFHHAGLPGPLAERLAAAALAGAESAWPAAEKLLQLGRGRPATIHLYDDAATFRTLEQQHTGSKDLREVVVRLREQEAHLLLWPTLVPRDLDVVGLPVTTIDNLVLAAAQLLAAQRSNAAASDPWLGTVFAYAVLEGRAPRPATAGVDPIYDWRRHWHCDQEQPPSVRSWILNDSPPRTRDELERANEACCLFAQMLANGGADWARKLLASPAKPGAGATVVRDAAVERVLGKDWAKTSDRWRQLLIGWRPEFLATAPMVARDGARWLMIGSFEKPATMWWLRKLPEGPYRLQLRCTLHHRDDDGLRVEMDWDEKSLVAFFLRSGGVAVGTWTREKNWGPLTQARAAIVAGKPFDVVIAVDAEPGRVTVDVDGVRALRWPYAGRTMQRSIALVKNEGPAWVEGVRIEPAGK
jgi:hypothetical protein